MKVSLSKEVDLRWTGQEWELLAPVIAVVIEDAQARDIIVPVGANTDLASIPRAFRSITPQIGKHIPAAIIHDYLYRTASEQRATADAIFLAGMEHLGVYGLRRQAMYRAVRAFGWLAYNKGNITPGSVTHRGEKF